MIKPKTQKEKGRAVGWPLAGWPAASQLQPAVQPAFLFFLLLASLY